MNLHNRLHRLEQHTRAQINPKHLERVRSLTPAKMDVLDDWLIADELASLGYPVPGALADKRRLMADLLEIRDRPPDHAGTLFDHDPGWTWDTYRQQRIAHYRYLTGDGPRPQGLRDTEDPRRHEAGDA